MQLLNFITSLNTPDKASPDSPKGTSAEDLIGAAAQFSGLLNQAIQEQTPLQGLPQVLAESAAPNNFFEEIKVSLTETSEESALAGMSDIKVETPEATGEAKEIVKANAPFFPLNIVSALQSLLNPQATNKTVVTTEDSVPSEIVPEHTVDTAKPPQTDLATELPSQLPLKAAASPLKTSLLEPNALENSLKQPDTSALESEPIGSTQNNNDIMADTQPPQSSIAENKENSKRPASAKDPASIQQSSLNLTITNEQPLLPAVPVQANLIAPAAPTIQTEDFRPKSSDATTTIQSAQEKPTTLPVQNLQAKSSNQNIHMEQAVSPGFEKSANTTFNNPSPESQLDAMATPPLATSESVVQPAQVDSAELPSITMDIALTTEVPAKANNSSTSFKAATVNPKVATSSENNTSKLTPDLSHLQDISQKLNALNGQVEASPSTFVEALKNEASTDVDVSASIPESNVPLHPTSFEQVLQSASDVSVSSPEPTKLPAFLSNAAHPADQIVEGTTYSVKNGHQELIIKLNPDNLGEVRVNLSTSGKDGINARLIASSAESHEVLQSHITHLKTSLEAQGIRLDNLSVVVAGNTESSNQMGQQNQQHQNFQQSDSQQQKMSQQDFNQQQQNPFNSQLAFNLGQQGGNSSFKSNYAQAPSNESSNWQEPTSGTTNTTQNVQRNDNGSISVLA